jgi:hypothetical protein
MGRVTFLVMIGEKSMVSDDCHAKVSFLKNSFV